MQPDTQAVATHTPPALWALFWSLFVIVSAIDYYVVTHRKGGITVKSALRWTLIWVCTALSFAVAIYTWNSGGHQSGRAHLAGDPTP